MVDPKKDLNEALKKLKGLVGGLAETDAQATYNLYGGAKKTKKTKKTSKESVKKTKKTSKKSSKKSSKKGGDWWEKKMEGGVAGDVRRFKIVEINGKKVEHTGRYSAKHTPEQAAKKAVRAACDHLGDLKKSKCEVTMKIQEVTRGSDKKVYGPYAGLRKKLSKPIIIKRKKGKDTKIEYEHEVSLLSKNK